MLRIRRFCTCLQRNGKEAKQMFKEKSGVEVLVIGKRLIVYDGQANKVGQCKLNNYVWEVTKGNARTRV